MNYTPTVSLAGWQGELSIFYDELGVGVCAFHSSLSLSRAELWAQDEGFDQLCLKNL